MHNLTGLKQLIYQFNGIFSFIDVSLKNNPIKLL